VELPGSSIVCWFEIGKAETFAGKNRGVNA